jgi:hypothetical protein
MNSTVKSNEILQRSLERVKNLGEVFTPPSSVEDMLKLLSSGKRGFWGDEDKVFFEPNCGHGNIVIAIYQKRLQALYKKAQSQNNKDAALFAIANAINTLWAIDIDATNVNQCRSRVLMETLIFLQQKTDDSTYDAVIRQHSDFIAHTLCAINWHIQENETLSSLSSAESAKANAEKTKSGSQWFAKHGHRPLVFDLSWVDYCQQCKQDNLANLTHQRAVRFMTQLLAGNFKESSEFLFTNDLAAYISSRANPVTKTKKRVAG